MFLGMRPVPPAIHRLPVAERRPETGSRTIGRWRRLCLRTVNP